MRFEEPRAFSKSPQPEQEILELLANSRFCRAKVWQWQGARHESPARRPEICLDPVAVFELRAWARAQLYAACVYDLLDAVDELQIAAEESGLIDQLGQDRVQQIIADAFHEVPQ